jgi:hypothetical protein
LFLLDIVSKQHIITASHCTQDKRNPEKLSSKTLSVLLGAHNLHEPDDITERRTVSAMINHPDWKYSDQKYDADIAIAILSTPVEYTSFISPACLHPQRTDNSDVVNATGIIAGWGITETGDTSEVDPKSLRITIVSNSECLQSNSNFKNLTSYRTFCAGITKLLCNVFF